MVYNETLANWIREALSEISNVVEKKMFGGLAFLINDKMCINVNSDNLICWFDPNLVESISKRKGYKNVIIK